MPNAWKRFAAWVTSLRNNLFLATRLRLTFFYMLILAVLLVLFSQIVAAGFIRDLEFRTRRFPGPPEQRELFIQEAEDRLRFNMLIVNGGILFLVGSLSYFLAGKTLSPIQKALHEQKQFLSDASHELRTPLSILKTNIELELLAKKSDQREHKKNLQSNLEEVNRMARLVNELLLIARLDSRRGNVQYGSISLTEVLETAVVRLKSYAFNHNVNITRPLPRQKLMVSGDRDALLTVFSNIMKNAIEYNKKNGVVSVSAQKTAGYISVRVTDTGIGIPKDQIPLVFNRFHRVDISRTGKTDNNGLGLSIAQAVVHEHHGEIVVKSKENEGTTITVTLPDATLRGI